MKIDKEAIRERWREESEACLEHIMAHIGEVEEVWATEPDAEEKFLTGQIKIYPFRQPFVKQKK